VVFIIAGTALMSAPTTMTYVLINLASAGIILMLFVFLLYQRRHAQALAA
jgi:hypothetical protein